MLPAKAEWEAGLSADAVLRDQCLSVGLQEPSSSRQEMKRGKKEEKKKKRMSKGCSGETGMRENLYYEICTLMFETKYLA